jgi:hypothetical protein
MPRGIAPYPHTEICMERWPTPPRAFWLAILLGLAVRAAIVTLVDYRIDAGDAAGYDQIARNLVERGVFSLDSHPPFRPTLVRPPIVPGVAAATYVLFGHRQWPLQLLQVVVSMATALVLFGALRRAAPGLAWPAFLLLLVSPFDALYTGALLGETITTFFVVSAVCLPLYGFRGCWLAAGACAGAAALTRDVYVLLPLAMAGAVVLGRVAAVPLRRRVAHAGALLLGAVLVVSPWTARNFQRSGAFVPVSKGVMGVTLWVGAWERNGDWQGSGRPAFPPEAYRFGGRELVEESWRAPDRHRDTVFMRLAREHYTRQPGAVLGAWAVRYPKMWVGTRFELFSFRPAALAHGEPLWYALKAGLWALNLAVLCAALAGVLFLRRHPALLWIAAPVLYNALIYVPFHNTETRYSQPVYPLLLVFAAATAVALRERVRRVRPAPH